MLLSMLNNCLVSHVLLIRFDPQKVYVRQRILADNEDKQSSLDCDYSTSQVISRDVRGSNFWYLGNVGSLAKELGLTRGSRPMGQNTPHKHVYSIRSTIHVHVEYFLWKIAECV